MPTHHLQARKGVSPTSANISGTIGANTDSTRNAFLLTEKSRDES